jgi:hypothetical protein
MFRTVPLSIIRSFSQYTQQWYMPYSFADSLRAGSGSCSQAVCRIIWHTPLLCLQWKTLDDGQRNCPKHVEFHSKNKFEELVHLIGFIIRNVSWCTVTWTSNTDEYQPASQWTYKLRKTYCALTNQLRGRVKNYPQCSYILCSWLHCWLDMIRCLWSICLLLLWCRCDRGSRFVMSFVS